jgi:hypothetical protein
MFSEEEQQIPQKMLVLTAPLHILGEIVTVMRTSHRTGCDV